MSALQPLDAMGGVNMTIPVRAINRSDSPQKWIYDRVEYMLHPEVPTFVHYGAMCLYRGDPRAIDLPGERREIKYRRLERERLSVFLGVYENEERWADVPQVDCYPIDSDTPFATVVADPTGESLSDVTAANTDQALMQAGLESMASQMRAMQAEMMRMRQEQGAVEAAGIDPADLDRQATSVQTLAPDVIPTPAAPVRSKAVKKRLQPGEGPQVTTDGE